MSLIELPRLRLEPVRVSDGDRDRAETLYREALAKAEAKKGGDAMDLAVEALRFNPDHKAIRWLLGFRLQEGQWRTAWEIKRLEEGYVDHPDFGWLPGNHVARYEGGERFISDRGWFKAAAEAEIRRDMPGGWEIFTEHYDIRTNHSLEEGVRTGRRLEHLYRAWKLLFYRTFFTDEVLARLFADPPASGGTLPRHSVYVYRNKDDYVENLKTVEPQIVHVNGLYLPDRKRAYFFPASPDMDEFDADTVRKALFHEGTHQLFQESRPRRNLPGQRANFWIVEGIAMFMETLEIREDRYALGDMLNNRLYAAKVHCMEHDFYVPFANLTRLGQAGFQSHAKLQRLYSQSAGMTQFLMQEGNGKDRAAVMDLLRQVYAGSDRADSLLRLTKRKYAELDEEYFEFLKKVP